MTTMSPEAIWGVILVAGVGTFTLRLSFLGALTKATEIPEIVKRALRLVPAAVLAAFVTPALARAEGQIDLFSDRLLAALVAALVAWRTKSMLATLAAGMSTLWLLAWLV